MTTPAVATEHFTDLARRGQQAVTTAAESVMGALRTYADAVTPRGPQPVDPQTATTAVFDLADRLLHVQRAYVSTAVALLSETGDAVTAHASAAGGTTAAEAVERMVDLATETTRHAAAARNGVSV